MKELPSILPREIVSLNPKREVQFEETLKCEERKKKFDKNIKRFNILFPKTVPNKERGKRRRNSISQGVKSKLNRDKLF